MLILLAAVLHLMSFEIYPGFFAGLERFPYQRRKSVARHIFRFFAYFFDFDCGMQEHFGELFTLFAGHRVSSL